MPNYCYNSISIESSDETLAKIRKLVNGENNVFDFARIFPMPADVEDWFTWNCKHWGTKWNSVEAHENISDRCLSYDFDTAWSPCEPIVKVLVAMFPDTRITFRYYEEGNCFCGHQEYDNGRLVYSVEGDYYEYWFDNYNEDDESAKDILKEKEFPGVFFTPRNENDLGSAITYDFTYRDTDDARSLHIEGFCFDARDERKPFDW